MTYKWPAKVFRQKRIHPNLTNKMYPYWNDPFLSDGVRRLVLLLKRSDGQERHAVVISKVSNNVFCWVVEDKTFAVYELNKR